MLAPSLTGLNESPSKGLTLTVPGIIVGKSGSEALGVATQEPSGACTESGTEPQSGAFVFASKRLPSVDEFKTGFGIA